MRFLDKLIWNAVNRYTNTQIPAVSISELERKRMNHSGQFVGGGLGIGLQKSTREVDEFFGHCPTHIRLHRANNGFVVEYTKHNDRHSEPTQSLHIVPDGEDLGQAIAHILTLETLRR
jgi:hypothetical protein